jgi:hypothetical protein
MIPDGPLKGQSERFAITIANKLDRKDGRRNDRKGDREEGLNI